jgi:hypothetical protein
MATYWAHNPELGVRIPHSQLHHIREAQEQCTERLPSMIVPLWRFARPLIPRVKGREGLCG